MVMFADIVGFTSLAEGLDPEYVGELVNSLWEGLDRLIEDHGGAVDKHVGDAVMATWGALASREDDAERALACALAMSPWLEEYSNSFRFSDGRSLSSPLRMRTGINAGLVLHGPIGTVGELSVMGDAVNTASRIQSAADPGCILVSGSVFRSCSGSFDFESARSLPMKGKAEPVETYRALRAKARRNRGDGRGLEGIAVRMVGREAELKLLLSLYEASKRGLVKASVVGDPGIGKSRLLREFLDGLELSADRVPLLMARCLPSSASEPYGVIRSLVVNRLGLKEAKSEEANRRAFLDSFISALGSANGPTAEEAREAAAVTGAFLGFGADGGSKIPSDARTLAARALDAIRRFFLSFAPLSPLLVVEDVHWADARSLEALEAMFPPEACLCAILSGRPSVEETHPGFLARWSPERQLRLKPLDYLEVLDLSRGIFRGFAELPDELASLIRSRAEGVPYFIEELARMLMERGVIDTGALPWTLDAARLGELSVPDTLKGILQARIDSLAERDRLALMGASVIGRTFWDEAVVSVLKDRCRLQKSAFDGLHGKELIFPRRDSSVSGLKEYMFKHALLRDVAYESILKRDRPAYHHRAARWLVEHSDGKAGLFAGTIAEHFELAGRYAEAARWFESAASQAAATWDNASAIGFYDRALETGASAKPARDPRERYRLLAARERVLDRIGDRARQKADLDAMMEFALSPSGSERDAASVHLRLASYRELTSEYDASFASALEADAVAARALRGGGPAGELKAIRAESLYLRGRALWRKGDLSQALEYLKPAVEAARQLGLGNLEAEALRNLGAAQFHVGDVEEAIRLTKESLELARKAGNDSAMGSALNNLGDEYRYMGKYDEACLRFSEALGIHRRAGEKWAMSFTFQNLALTFYRMGRPEETRKNALEAAAYSAQIGLRQIQQGSSLLLGHLAFDEGDYAEAQEHYARSLEHARALDNALVLAEARSHLAKAMLKLGQRADALTAMEGSMEAYQGGNLDGLDEPYDVLLTAVENLEALGDPRAKDVLSAALSSLERNAKRLSSDEARRDFMSRVEANARLAQRAPQRLG